MPDVFAAIDATVATVGAVITALGAIIGVLKAFSSFGPDRDTKLMENFERQILASQGEAIIWKRRAESAEARTDELETELDELRGAP